MVFLFIFILFLVIFLFLLIFFLCLDGGKTIHNGNEEINEKIKNVSNILNLKEHKAGESNKNIYSCIDLEGHQSKIDKRMYCLDFSRIMPCTFPDEIKGKYSHLYCLFSKIFIFFFLFFILFFIFLLFFLFYLQKGTGKNFNFKN